MSDAKGSTGAFEDLDTAHQTVRWEARLDLARQQRAKILAKTNGAGRAKPEQNEVPCNASKDAPSVSTEVKIEHDLSTPDTDARKPRDERQRVHSVGLIVLAALLCGAFLEWGSSKLSGGLQEIHAMPARQPTAAPEPTAGEKPEPAKVGPVPASLGIGPEVPGDRLGHSLALIPPSKFVFSGSPGPLPEQELYPYSVLESESALLESGILSGEEIDRLGVTDAVSTIEVALFVPANVSSEASERALGVLKDGQAKVVASARVGYSVRETHVRYYHPNDAVNAVLAADALGGISRDFTQSGTKTPPGRIEVYLAGTGGRSGQRTNSQSSQTEFEKFLARLLEEIQ